MYVDAYKSEHGADKRHVSHDDDDAGRSCVQIWCILYSLYTSFAK